MADESGNAVAELEDVDKPAESVPGQEADEKPDKPAEGTPDKSLQKMQQELGNVTRQLAALTEKKQESGGLSDADKAKLAKAEDRIGKIRKFVDRTDRDELASAVDPVAEQVLDLSEKISEQDKLKSELAKANERLTKLEGERSWAVANAKYAGLDTKAIWLKAVTDAEETLADTATEASVVRLASKWFEERCDAAKKRQGEPAKTNNKAAVADPSTYKVGSGKQAAPQLSDEEEAIATARSLVREI